MTFSFSKALLFTYFYNVNTINNDKSKHYKYNKYKHTYIFIYIYLSHIKCNRHDKSAIANYCLSTGQNIFDSNLNVKFPREQKDPLHDTLWGKIQTIRTTLF